MSSSITFRGAQLLPLWRRRIPKYPVYWKGDPQRRLFLPLFWMKLIKPEQAVPKNEVHFETHPQMSHFDIKNYLEKVYKVPVLNVRTDVLRGEQWFWLISTRSKHFLNNNMFPSEFTALLYMRVTYL
ncbi:39S ribosomal protein L23, mitochondrial [Aplysia californica]|uniref:Large ribosomal subunit protein uL23m n=1 Tax=Aplysia californica TaxID=6500 RepID=A0ABM1VSP4_APLCA|nr:39S ribosomal protein L23, mitochondrial [Aplysia californica]